MSTIKIDKLICVVICLVLSISVVKSYGAQGKAEEFFEQGKKYTSVDTADKAIAAYTKAIKINPKLGKAYNNRGVAYMMKKQYDQALADFNKAIKLDPKNGKAYNNRAIVYAYLGENLKANQDINKAKSLGIAVDPNLLKNIEALPTDIPEPIFHKPGPPADKASKQKK
ncbi:MAG: tetratricopeptide repeat protein [Syntrophales bacterium]|nr:tetratricopeptide repeat protein [Syntrophales bacterium]MDD5642759.1 tetratricopeptide repeat protein [Syntrophales bacterium]